VTAAADAIITPGATLGVFGGGQLGRMFAAAAARMGYRAVVFAPEADGPAARVAHDHIRADYADDDAVRRFAEACDAITLEFENVPASAVDLAADITPVRPGAGPLAVAQDRLKERAFLDRFGFAAAPHAAVRTADDLARAVEQVGTPAVLKTATLGYDGRGQAKLDRPADAADAWASIGTGPALYEGWVAFDCEVSVLVARSPRGEVTAFGPIRNEHANHILDVSSVPAGVDPAVADGAVELARGVAEALGLEGLICVEMFVTPDGSLLVNELAPRPHNSGHLTIEACGVSQFEQQVRAMCNLPLGTMTLPRPAAMANLLGDVWANGEPDWPAALQTPDLALHLYGKTQARAGRKMGHLTALADTPEQAIARVTAARKAVARAAPL